MFLRIWVPYNFNCNEINISGIDIRYLSTTAAEFQKEKSHSTLFLFRFMSSEITTQKSSAASSADVIDVEKPAESNIQIIDYSNGTLKHSKNDSDTETDDELENMTKATSKGTASLTASQTEQSNNISPNKIVESTEALKRKRVKLEEVKNFDILLPNNKNGHGVREAKKYFYTGFISFRKLIDKLRSVFMEHDTPEHQTKISQWLVGKIAERNGRFLREEGDGTSGNCKVMTLRESLQYTICAFQDGMEWPAILASIEGTGIKSTPVVAANPLTMPQLTAGVMKPPQAISISANNSSQVAANRATTGEVRVTQAAPAAPPLKKLKTADGEAAMSPKLNATADQNVNKKLSSESNKYGTSMQLQKIMRERQLIRTELEENHEILLMRQERLSQLECEFRIFLDRQMFLHSERWLSEKILRQEEIFENRELLGIQRQRCLRLQTLLELNERQLLELQSKLRSEKFQSPENSQTIGQEAKAEAIQTTETLVEAEIKKHQQTAAAQRALDERIAFETEFKRRMAAEQRSAMEMALEQRKAMEHEIQYRHAMEHAMRRQATMQQAMKVRQLMMERGETALVNAEDSLLETEILNSIKNIPKPSSDPKPVADSKPSSDPTPTVNARPTPDPPAPRPDVAASSSTATAATTKPTTIIIERVPGTIVGGQNSNQAPVVVETSPAEEAEESDDDYSIVI